MPNLTQTEFRDILAKVYEVQRPPENGVFGILTSDICHFEYWRLELLATEFFALGLVKMKQQMEKKDDV